MIMLCERCYSPIVDGEAVLRLAHIDGARPDGHVSWVHTYVHTAACTTVAPAAHERPDTGEWDPARGVRAPRP